jgi:peroxiredoxin
MTKIASEKVSEDIQTKNYSRVLFWAALYNLVWGAWVVLLPGSAFSLLGIDPPNYLFIWQCVGMIVGVYGIGYAIAAMDPLRHWPIVLVGFLGKIFGPLGYLWGVVMKTTPVEFGYLLITNDLIWWIPFFCILKAAYEKYQNEPEKNGVTKDIWSTPIVNSQETLGELSSKSKCLVVFLRHAGCIFCREAISDLAKVKTTLDSQGVTVVLVFQGDSERIQSLLQKYSLSGVLLISDPERILYNAFELRRGSLSQLFGLKVWLRGFQAMLAGHGVGALDGDGFQMPGAFVVKDKAIVRAFRHAAASDRPDYCGLVQ